jgi:glycosyltransferase involved in cell wall biosynthesis
MKKLVIDVNSIIPLFMQGYLSGIGRTTLELVREMDRLRDSLPFEILLYTQNIRGFTPRDFGISLPYRNLFLPSKDYINPYITPFRLRTLLTRYDLWHCPHNDGDVDNIGKTIFTLHDLFVLTCPGEFPEKVAERVRRIFPEKLGKCRAIITCSESSKNDIIRFFDIDPGKIHVTYWGINHAIFKPVENREFLKKELATKYGIDEPYFFACSCNYRRKNTVELIKAYNLLAKQNPENDLVVLWNYYGADIEELVRDNSRIHLIRRVSDEDLAKLYNGATATYYPSKYEGFGLPILESMACGTPVVTARNSSLPEIGLDIASYLETNDIEGILSSMENIEKGAAFAPAAVSRGIERASSFTWERCAEKTLDVYKNIFKTITTSKI